MDLQLFIPITKIDVAQRLVTGTIAEEIPDRADEIMDYETAKPMFEAWSAEIVKASNGRSVGNLRGDAWQRRGGQARPHPFDDGARRIATVAKVVDDREWQKVLEGVTPAFRWAGAMSTLARSGTRADPLHAAADGSLAGRPSLHSLRHLRSGEGGWHGGVAEVPVSGRARRGARSAGICRSRLSLRPQEALSARHAKRISAPPGPISITRPIACLTRRTSSPISKRKIVAAWKAKIDPKGPPLSAGKAVGALRDSPRIWAMFRAGAGDRRSERGRRLPR